MDKKLKKLIDKYIELSIQSSEEDYVNKNLDLGEKLYEKALVLYVRIISMPGGKEAYKDLLSHENKYVATDVAVHVLNGEDDEEALKVIKKYMVEKNEFGEQLKGYYERYIKKDKNRDYWIYSLDKMKNKLKAKGKITDVDVETEEEKANNIPFTLPIFNDDKSDPINNFMQENYKGEYTNIKDENEDNQYINIDINIINQKDEEFYIVYTTGMSDFPMNVPKTFFGKYNKYKYGELITLIPKEWDNDFNSKKWQGLIKLLRELATYPHLSNTWISSGHTLETDMSELNKKFVSVGLSEITILGKNLKVNKKWIRLYMIIPMYKEDLEYKFEYGFDKWFEKMATIKPSPFLFQLDRKSCIK